MTDWTPPAGMDPRVVGQWRAFYGNVQREYGITARQYRDLYIAQHGCCYICRVAKGKHPDDPKGRGGRRLAVDHNHVTGAVRGLLCSGGDKTCNRVIGWLSISALERAVEYVRTEPAQRVLGRLERANGNGGGDAFQPEYRDHWLREVLDLR